MLTVLLNIFPQVESVDLPMDQGGVRPKGYGYIYFATREDLHEALGMDEEVSIKYYTSYYIHWLLFTDNYIFFIKYSYVFRIQ